MKFTLTIETGDAEFADNPDLATAHYLDNVAARIRNGYTEGKIRGVSNGGAVGEWKLEPDAS